MEVFSTLNGFTISADVDEQEELFLALAAGEISRETLTEWIDAHLQATS